MLGGHDHQGVGPGVGQGRGHLSVGGVDLVPHIRIGLVGSSDDARSVAADSSEHEGHDRSVDRRSRLSAVISAEVRAAFESDGVVKIPGAVDGEWVARILEDAQTQLDDPGPWVTDTNPGAAQNRLFTTRYRWRHAPVIRDFVFSSPVAAMAASLTGSERMRFYFDHLLVKEPLTSAPTPWHQDIPYWPFLGKQIVSAWVAATSSRVSHSSLEFVRGSHRWDAYYAPTSFDGQGGWTEDFKGDPMPDVEATRGRSDCPYEIVGFDVEPGDAIFFSA
ncbi:MAG: phytanoyl-CoA dioxygenase family protein, partial [Acidimicrobiaceae bacterium]|nr:phytanoyl-CoA dioxygenase family protein [Acidimicrobiaceae bacterium]